MCDTRQRVERSTGVGEGVGAEHCRANHEPAIGGAMKSRAVCTMHGMHGLLATVVTVAVVAVLGCGGGGDGGGGGNQPTPVPTPVATPSGPAGAGVQAEILSAEIEDGGRVTVLFSLTDDAGEPITPVLSSTDDDQQARVRLTIAHLEEYAGGGDLGNSFLRYVNQVNQTTPAYDRNGTLELVDGTRGVWRYVFATAVSGPVPTDTYTVGMQVDRDFAGVEEWANPVFDFVPGGGTATVWEDTTTDQCNVCHQPLIAHGNRREVRLCKLCHTEAATDEKGTSIDLRNMIHMIHAGKELPSVVDGPPGSQYGIFSSFAMEDVVFAQKQADGNVTGVGFPRPLEECRACHAEGPTAEYYRTKPATAACATCHDDVNPSTRTTKAGPPGTNHPPGAFADGQCSACHKSEMSHEFDISVPGAHVVPEQSAQLQGLNVNLLDVRDHDAAQTPTIAFSVTNDAGAPLRDLTGLNRLAFALAGPTTDYQQLLLATVVGGGASGTLVGPDANGVFEYTYPAAIPAEATGSWSVGAEARRNVQLTEDITTVEAAPNPVVSFTVDGASGALQIAAHDLPAGFEDPGATPRRTVVDNQKCFACHGEFSKGFQIHGGLRNRVEYCVMCHNPDQSDAARRRNDPAQVAAGAENATIDFKVMPHKIHRGENLTQQPYDVYGFGPAPANYSVIDFGEVLYPGDLRKCDRCHVDGSQLIPPFPGTARGTLQTHLNPSDGSTVVDGVIPPMSSACTSCHDSDEAWAHVESQTTSGGIESCEVCHAEGRPFAVSVMHATNDGD